MEEIGRLGREQGEERQQARRERKRKWTDLTSKFCVGLRMDGSLIL